MFRRPRSRAEAIPAGEKNRQETQMAPEYAEGLRIMAVGITGVFANLIIVMLVVLGLKLVFGKKSKRKS